MKRKATPSEQELLFKRICLKVPKGMEVSFDKPLNQDSENIPDINHHIQFAEALPSVLEFMVGIDPNTFSKLSISYYPGTFIVKQGHRVVVEYHVETRKWNPDLLVLQMIQIAQNSLRKEMESWDWQMQLDQEEIRQERLQDQQEKWFDQEEIRQEIILQDQQDRWIAKSISDITGTQQIKHELKKEIRQNSQTFAETIPFAKWLSFALLVEKHGCLGRGTWEDKTQKRLRWTSSRNKDIAKKPSWYPELKQLDIIFKDKTKKLLLFLKKEFHDKKPCTDGFPQDVRVLGRKLLFAVKMEKAKQATEEAENARSLGKKELLDAKLLEALKALEEARKQQRENAKRRKNG